MKEYNREIQNNSEASTKKESFLSRLENFWYHYKWHSVIALFLVFTISICSVQMCQKESYDLHVLYSGGYEINRKGSDGNASEYKTTLSSLGRVTDDNDGDGVINVTLKDLFMLSSAEIEEIEGEDDKTEVNYALINDNKQILRDTIMYSSYYVCLLSPAVYEEYKTVDGVEIFTPLAQFSAENTSLKYYDDNSVYLSSTKFYSLPGISSLPDNTLVCLKKPSVFASHFNEKETKRDYARAETAVIKILNYK